MSWSIVCDDLPMELLPWKQYWNSHATVNFLRTAQLQWLEHRWNHENMFETGVVRANECLSERPVRRHNKDIFSIFFNMKMCYVFSLESSHHTIFNIKKENHPKLSKTCSYGIFPRKLRTSSKQPCVFEPLKFYCIARNRCERTDSGCP